MQLGHMPALPKAAPPAARHAVAVWDLPCRRGRHLAAGLDLGVHGLSGNDRANAFSTGRVACHDRMKLGGLLARLKATYPGPIGAECMHISDAGQRRWVYGRLEKAGGKYGR